MIEGLMAELSLPQWNTVLGIIAAVVTVFMGVVKLRKKIFSWLYFYPKNKVLLYISERDREYAERIFEEMKPMLEQEILHALEGYTDAVAEQRITIASAIAENVEFRNFITGSISVMQDTMTKVANAVEINACDAKAIRQRLNTEGCDIAEGCNRRVHEDES